MSEHEFWAACPDVEIDPEKLSGQPTVGSYRLAVRTLIEAEELGQSPEEMAEEYDVPLSQVKTILGYYHSHQRELIPSR